MQFRTYALDHLVRLAALFTVGYIYGRASSIVEAQASHASNGCLPQQCGKIKVSYPFKLSTAPECPSFNSFFELECDDKSGDLLFNRATNGTNYVFPLKVLSLDLMQGTLIVDVSDIVSRLAFNTSIRQCKSQPRGLILPGFPSPYVFSNNNILASFGCGFSQIITANPAEDSTTFTLDGINIYKDVNAEGCEVDCPFAKNSQKCGNQLCCTIQWPDATLPRWAYFAAETNFLSNVQYDQNNCSSTYAAILHPSYSNLESRIFRLELQWALPFNFTTNQPSMQSPDYECSNRSNISKVPQIPGYRCFCPHGYYGDGYTKGTKCTGNFLGESSISCYSCSLRLLGLDINECENDALNECTKRHTECRNKEGDYECRCTSPFRKGNGRRKPGTGCYFSRKALYGFVAGSFFLLLIMLLGSYYYAVNVCWKRRLKRQYFKEHGGTQLQEMLLMGSRGEESRRLFNEQELEDATNNFSAGMKLGTGGFGTVFKGFLADGKIVAIKRANKSVNAEQLFNEIKIMVQLNHRNIVRFLGCCLETQQPLLVYEYVSNGNILENLREGNPDCMNWEQRVKVATQTAEALAYLHGVTLPPILHRDVKSSNVLLDNNFDAKVADFGVSRLVPEGASHISTAVQGTLGYLDPEYFQTLQLTEKSDVYSLGVMLVELITGLKAVDTYSREARYANLAILFIHHMRDLAKIDDIIDNRLLAQDRPSIVDMSSVAVRCLSPEGCRRPLMSEVAYELRRIMHTYHGVKKMENPTIAQSPNHYGFAAVIATGSDVGIDSNSWPTNSTSSATDDPLLGCTLPR